jgi:hypothetical protein
MRTLQILFIASILFSITSFRPADAAPVIVGVVPPGFQSMNEQQQDALLDQLVQAHVHTIRTGFSDLRPMPPFTRFITEAYKRGIGTIFILNPTEGNKGLHTRPADPSLHLWAQPPLTDASPDGFKKVVEPVLSELEASGVRFTAFELGNEINNSQFNGDFVSSLASGRVLGINDLNNPRDAEGQRLAASFKAYLEVLATLKDIRDQSKLNRQTPIISAGLVSGAPGSKPGLKLDGVAGLDTLEFLKQNGLDRLVDGYGIHSYSGAKDSDPFFKACGHSKPCWVTEWGFVNKNQSCPLDDSGRRNSIASKREQFRAMAEQGEIVNITYFSWNDANFGIFRCGALTDAGQLALSPMQ